MRWIRRLLFGAGLLGALLVVGLVVVAWAVFSAMQSDEGAEEGPGLTCTSTVTVAPATRDVPPEVLEPVTEAVEDTGREVEVLDGYSTEADVLVLYVEGQEPYRSRGTDPVTLRFGDTPSVEQVAGLMGDRLTPCAEEEQSEPSAPAEEPTDPASDLPWLPWWPWSSTSPATWIAAALLIAWMTLPAVALLRHPEPVRLLPTKTQQAIALRKKRKMQ